MADATEALENHPGMLVRPHHFATLRINWNDKAQNLREIAAELNIGIDTLALLDDNPVERERVRMELPEVTVIELPEDPMQYSDALRMAAVFERLVLSDEDRERGPSTLNGASAKKWKRAPLLWRIFTEVSDNSSRSHQ
jgi:FkbH-like protein